MIICENPKVWQLLFSLRGSVLPKILPRILGIMVFAAVLVVIDTKAYSLPHTNAAPFAVFGIALSLFLGFRNNAAYARWWDGRKLWGQHIANLRALAREVELHVSNKERRDAILRLALTFIHLHRISLRKLPVVTDEVLWFVQDYADTPNPTCAALNAMNKEVLQAIEADEVDGFGRICLSNRLAEINHSQAGCEGIATTPLPLVYSMLVYRTAYLYCLLIPLGLLEPVGMLTPVFVGIIAYMFFGLAEVTEELSEPFGETLNGLPLDAMCRTIERSLAVHLSIDPPAALEVKDHYLS